jgi:hypothetical protein
MSVGNVMAVVAAAVIIGVLIYFWQYSHVAAVIVK